MSHHLKKLVQAGLLTREQRGVWAFYGLDREGLERAATVLDLEGSGMSTTDVHEQVRERYAEAATSLSQGCGCGCDCETIGCCGEEATTLFGQGLYEAGERAALPENAVAASLGWGTRSPWRRCTRARPCSTLARAVASTSFSRPVGSALAPCTGST